MREWRWIYMHTDTRARSSARNTKLKVEEKEKKKKTKERQTKQKQAATRFQCIRIHHNVISNKQKYITKLKMNSACPVQASSMRMETEEREEITRIYYYCLERVVRTKVHPRNRF